MKNKYLLLTFLIFAVGFIAAQFYFEKKPRTLQTSLLKLAPEQVTSLMIYPSVDQQEAYLLKREDHFWVAHKADITLRVEQDIIEGILANLSHISINKVVARGSKEWANFNLTNNQANRIKIFVEDQLKDEFYVHQFDTSHNSDPHITYIRLLTGGEIYEVNSHLSVYLSKGFNSYRNRTVLSVNPSTIQSIAIQTTDYWTILENKRTGWVQDNLPVDSTTLYNYLNGLKSIESINFVDDFDPYESIDLTYKTLAIQNKNGQPIIIKAYLDSTRTIPYIIEPTQYPNSFFTSSENGVLEQLFGDW